MNLLKFQKLEWKLLLDPIGVNDCQPVSTNLVNLDDHEICRAKMYLHTSVQTCMKQSGHHETKLPSQAHKAQKAEKALSATPFLNPSLLRPCPSNETTTKDRPSCSGEEWAVKVHTVPKILTQRLKLSATRPDNEVSQVLAGTMKAFRCKSVRHHAH